MKSPGFIRLHFHPAVTVAIIVTLFLMTAAFSFAQDGISFDAAPPGERWTITTRWDYRVRIDGRYLGHVDKELREVYVRRGEVPGGWHIEVDARMLGNTKKDGIPVASRLDGRENTDFVLTENGSVVDVDGGYPRLRGFPTFPEKNLNEGDRWEAPLEILVTGPEGQKAVLYQTASYRFAGMSLYMNRDVYLIEAQWAVRHTGLDPVLNEFLNGLEGAHRVSLVVDAGTETPIMARDLLKETWRWADSRVEEREGFALIFWDGVPPLETDVIVKEFEGILSDDESGLDGASSDFEIERTPRGLSVILRNLHFQPNRAVIVADDYSLLDEIAGILKEIPDRTVMVRGHTADVGRPEAQYSLSEQRAKHIADELSRRGVDPRRLVYEGVGADEPVGDNSIEEGRRLNRRVELLILED